MKQSNHNDVDLLLRALARGEEEPWMREESANAVVSGHLDADELNLYAEGVLPAPARARYTEHVADCQMCRTLVVGLAQAAGHTVHHEKTTQQGGVKFWHSLATLFSLPVLRYALPALLLTVVIGIGLLALREQRHPDQVALNTKTEPAGAFDQAGNQSGSASAAVSPAPALQRQATDANTSSSELKNNPVGNSGLVTQTPDSNAQGITTGGTTLKDAAEPARGAGAVSQPIYAPEPAPPPKAPGEADAKIAARKEDSFEREAVHRQQDELKLLSKDEPAIHGPARSRTMSGGSRRDAEAPAENRAADKKAKREVAEEVETRRVSGRTFRREGNAWVDTAYQASRGATNVGRGSEQFRALLADEPGLRAIAQQLGGEVVVVWKNRVYRIR